MKNQKSTYFGIGIIVILFFIVFGLGRSYLMKQNQPTPTPIIKQKPTADTSNLTMYTNGTYGYSLQFPVTYYIPPQSDKQKSQVGIDNNIGVKKRADTSGTSIIVIDVNTDNDNLSLGDYMAKNLKIFGITGPLTNFNFNGYDSIFNKNQPGMNVFVKEGKYIYHINAPTASSDKEVEGIVATFKFVPGYSFGPQKSATVLVQDGSTYGPPFDPNLYQLEIDKSHHLFAKSDTTNLKQYLGRSITVQYREVKGVVMGEQQLVIVDTIN